MRRRDFITLLGGGAAVWPFAASAQQRGPVRRVGMLMTREESDPVTQELIALFQRRMAELGWIEDQNIRFNRRWSAGNLDRMRAQISELVGMRPDVILAQNTPTVAALKRATDSIPIVFTQVSDPVGDGFVASLAQPGGNVTGFTNTMSSLGGKWLAPAGGGAWPQARRLYVQPRCIAGWWRLLQGAVRGCREKLWINDGRS